MRLLQCNSNGKFILTKDFITDIPRFAILSHTWGADTDEVTFRDILEGHGEHKAGYEKIRFCGERAKYDGLQYFWLDTCCIDKSNNTELVEAINSMFRWYRNAAKCYVYLSDVSKPAIDCGRSSDLFPGESEFRTSRWFTRGWTLQELVAPRTVEFFSKDRFLFGDRRSLEQVICEITGIPPAALRGDRPLQDFNVDERMSWAKQRNTTREEDAAYCLLGIFDISMPLIYGEGREKALRRLWKGIEETQSHSSVLSKDAQADSFTRQENGRFKIFTSSFNDAPVDLLSIHFIDRERELGLIQNAHQVCEENLPTRCAIWGIPGVGKTQLAIKYTKMFLTDPTVSAVFWMSCSNVEKLYQGFSRLLNLIDHPNQFKMEQNARLVGARCWLEQPVVSGILRWLLVLDNVDITTLDFLRDNLPRQGKRGRILFTTRTEAIARAVCKASGNLQLNFELEPPVMNDAVMFFLKSAGVSENSVSNVDQRQITDLMGCLGCLPFAIEHAASFMTQSSRTIEALTKLYWGSQKSHIFNWQNLDSAYEVKSVLGMFESRLHDLRRTNPEVYGLLNILVFWDPDRIEFAIIKAGALFLGTSTEPAKGLPINDSNWRWTQWSVLSWIRALYLGLEFSYKSPATGFSNLEPEKDALASSELESLIKMTSSEVQLESALQQLQMLSLIKRRSALEGGAWTIHDLTQNLVQVTLESEGTHLRWFSCAVRMACGAFRQIQNPALPENWHQCEGLISHILSLTRYSKLADQKNADLIRALGNIALYWCDRGRYHEARETYQQLLGDESDVLHDADVEKTQWKLGLAEVNWHLAKHNESALLYEEVRQIQKSQLGADHPDVLHTEGKLALVYRSQARYAEARSMLENALENFKTRLGPDHLDTVQVIETLAMTINECAEAENDEAQLAEAESLHKQALTCRETQLGADHLDTLWTADSLGTTYRAQGRHVEAVDIYERVLEGRTSQLGEDHPQVLWTVANLASAYTSLGRLDQAEVMYKRAIAGNEERLGHDHSETLWAVEGLADGYCQRLRLEQATSLYDRALRGMQGRLGAEHPSVMRLMHKLANVYRDRKDFAKSITLFEKLLELRKTEKGSTNPEMLRMYNDAAASYAGLGKHVEAEQCYRLGQTGSVEKSESLYSQTDKTEHNLAP